MSDVTIVKEGWVQKRANMNNLKGRWSKVHQSKTAGTLLMDEHLCRSTSFAPPSSSSEL